MVYVHLADGFEEVEALTVVDLLRRANIDAKTVSVEQDKTVEGAHGIKVEADLLFENADYDKCEMVVLPGGMPGAENLKKHKGLYDVIEEFSQKGKELAAICAAPMVLDGHAALAGKTVTIYPGFEQQLASVSPISADIVDDGNVLTGKGPAFAMKFTLAIIEKLKGIEAAEAVAKGLLLDRG